MNIYLVYKLIHIFAAVIFLGNIYAGLFWIHQAHRTRNILIIHYSFRTLIKSDKYFTIPGVTIVVIGGILVALQSDYPLLRTGWILWSVVIFTLVGFVFAGVLLPLQSKISKTLVNVEKENFNWGYYNQTYRAWEIWSFVAIIGTTLVLIMMILRWPN